jgi:hypothetical protein
MKNTIEEILESPSDTTPNVETKEKEILSKKKAEKLKGNPFIIGKPKYNPERWACGIIRNDNEGTRYYVWGGSFGTPEEVQKACENEVPENAEELNKQGYKIKTERPVKTPKTPKMKKEKIAKPKKIAKIKN